MYGIYPYQGRLRVKVPSAGEETMKALRAVRELRQRNGAVAPLFATIGGARVDSPLIVRLLKLFDEREPTLNEIERYRTVEPIYDGINIHWDRPGDACDKAFTSTFFRAFLRELKARQTPLMLTVPPVLELVQKFYLGSLMRYLDHVVVLTHMLRRRGVLDCSGRSELAAAAFFQIQEHVMEATGNAHHASKFAYSIGLGAEVFHVPPTTKGPQLMDQAVPAGVFNNIATGHPNRTGYDRVCLMQKEIFDSECAWVEGRTTSLHKEVALFAGPEELTARMRNAYNWKMGGTDVVVYDILLDDFDATCSPPGEDKDSPLLAAIAKTGMQ
ncbi:uncharacterized protein LOC144103388 [Amblyomma americanum]